MSHVDIPTTCRLQLHHSSQAIGKISITKKCSIPWTFVGFHFHSPDAGLSKKLFQVGQALCQHTIGSNEPNFALFLLHSALR